MGSFIQSTRGESRNNFELVVLERYGLAHYYRDNAEFNLWHYSSIITRNATGPAAIIQSTLNTPGNLEIVVLEGKDLVHYYCEDSGPKPTWHRTAIITSHASGPASFIQNAFSGNFEVVVREDQDLVHYTRDNSKPNKLWSRCSLITDRATTRGSLIQGSPRVENEPGNLEVVVLEDSRLLHYYHDSPDYSQPWHQAACITDQATGPGSLVRGLSGDQGRLDILVPQGHEIVHYHHETGDYYEPWHRVAVVTSQATGAASLIQGTLGEHGNLEAIVPTGHELIHYWYDRAEPSQLWNNTGVITDKL